MSDKDKITLLVPCYNEEEVLKKFYNKTSEVIDRMPQYAFVWLFVNDGSSDGTLAILRDLHQQDQRVCYISLSRNFGKEAAMLSGLDYATGDAVILMDADLQDPPELVPKLLAGWKQGYQDVYAQRCSRAGESWFKKISLRVLPSSIKKVNEPLAAKIYCSNS